MKASALALSLLLHASTGAAAAPEGPAPAVEPSAPLRARLTDEAIRQAVRETLAESRDRPAARGEGEGEILSGDGYRAFARDFAEARKPSCMAPDALKHQPPGLRTKNWNVGLGGLFALPFWAAAIVKGKCN